MKEKRIKAWKELITEVKHSAVSIQLEKVNNFFNQVQYVREPEGRDYWKTPEEFLSDGCGDCEDFAVAKYLTLKELRIEPPRTFLTYARVLHNDNFHLFVTYFFFPEHDDIYKMPPVYLDNLNRQILRASNRLDIIPVYCFSEVKAYIQNSNGLGNEITRVTKTQEKLVEVIKRRETENEFL